MGVVAPRVPRVKLTLSRIFVCESGDEERGHLKITIHGEKARERPPPVLAWLLPRTRC